MELELLSKIVDCSPAIATTSVFIISTIMFFGIAKHGESNGRDKFYFKVNVALSLFCFFPMFAFWGMIETGLMSSGLIKISNTAGLNPILLQIGFLILMGAVLVLSIVNSFRLSYRIEDRNLAEGKTRLV